MMPSMVAVTYVRDIDASRAFYGLLGFREQSSGRAATSAWSLLERDGLSVLLASTSPRLELPPLPLLFYFFCDDLDAVVAVLASAGVEVARTGHPPHALGGEVKMLDPDGNTVLVGQRERSETTAQSAAQDEDAVRFSLLKEAAALVSAQGGTTVGCQVRSRETACPEQAEVKLADTGGDVAWVCLAHAEEILITVPTAFIASQEPGIGAFMSHRR